MLLHAETGVRRETITAEGPLDTFCFVRPEHLSHQGFLFGGQLLKWVDEYSWIVAAREFPGNTLVTRAMDKIEFTKRVKSGSILRFDIRMNKKGTTSITYSALVYDTELPRADEELVFSTNVTFVAVDASGRKTRIN
jgi:acyl-CoA hydrolase